MTMINESIQRAYAVLDGYELTREHAFELAETKGEDILDLVSLANKVRHRFATTDHICTILNAKSGKCGQNCTFCAQSAHNEASVDVYPLLSQEEMVLRAGEAYATGVRTFGLVTAGTGFRKIDDEFKRIVGAMNEIQSRYPDMHVCTSLGILSDETAAALAAAGSVHYNINIQTNPERYGELVSTTHKIEERIETIKLLHKYGIKVCCGGILGLGETMIDRVLMAFALKELEVEVIPINVLVPIEGTPQEQRELVPAAEVAVAFALFRLINPSKTLKFAAGRESRMKDFQGFLMLAGANAMLTGGYLTTRGREVAEDHRLTAELKAFGG